MGSAFGIAVTNFTSKFGILSRKACMRYAEETGKKLVDKSKELGRGLTKEETEQVFGEVLPKKCIPTIHEKLDDAAKCLVNTGYSQEQATAILTQEGVGAGVIMNGCAKMPIYMPFEKLSNSLFNQSGVAHELEHALEFNNRIKKIFKRVKDGLKFKFLSKIDKNYMAKRQQKETEILIMQMQLQANNATFNFTDVEPMVNVLAIKPTRQAYIESRGYETEKRFMVGMREFIRNSFASSKRYDKATNRRLKWFTQTADVEIPAYTVQGEVERYALNLTKEQTPKATANTFVYDDAAKIMKRERYLYLKNRLTGKIKASDTYSGEKSLIKLAKTSEDKQILKELIKDMNENQKQGMFYALQNEPDFLKSFKALVDATKVDGKSVWTQFPDAVHNFDAKAVQNKDFLKIIGIKNAEYPHPEYIGCLGELSHLSPEQLSRFVKMAEVKGADGELKYKYLFRHLDNPEFETLKKIADIEVGGKNPYAEIVSYIGEKLNPEELSKVYKLISSLAKSDKEVMNDLAANIYNNTLDRFLSHFNI